MERNILNILCFKHLRPFHTQKTNMIFPSYHILHHVVPKKCNSFNFFHQNCKAVYNNCVFYPPTRGIKSSSQRLSKEKSKIEGTVKILKEEQEKAHTKKKSGDSKVVSTTSTESRTTSPNTTVSPPPKRSLGKRIIDEIVHYYNGFRLLFVDIKICYRLTWKLINGSTLSRRENRQLVRTVSDIFRLVPFSVFIVPFMEIFIPIVLKFFPQILPSTFETASDKERKFKAQLKLKIEMAKFLQETLDELALQAKGEKFSESAKEFANFFEKIRSTGIRPTNEEILKFSRLFQDEITLDSLPRPSLIALCRLLELQPIGTNNLLRFQLRMRLRTLKADDQLISKEGIESLSVSELQAACRARGMRALGLSEERLRLNLKSWLELHLKEEIPASLLLLSRALYLPENLDAPEQLKATLSTLPDDAATEAKYKIEETEGKVDNKTKLELIKKEEMAIKKETEETAQEKETEQAEIPVSDILTDKAPITKIEKELAEKVEFSKEDFDDLEDALENISNEKKALLIEKEEIEGLKGEMADYGEDIEELKDIVLETGHKELGESKAALRLSKKVNKMISKMDILVDDLKKERESLQHKIGDKDDESVSATKERDDIISINELVLAIRRIQKMSDDTKLQKIIDVLEKMDIDHDGAVEIDHVLKVIEFLGKENVKVSTKQLDEIIDLLKKEDSLELEEKKQKKSKVNLAQGKKNEK